MSTTQSTVIVTIDRDGRTVAQVSRAARDVQRAAERAQVATS